MNETFMKERPVLPLLASMAIPMVISMLVNSLYNIVDSFYVAQISEDAMSPCPWCIRCRISSMLWLSDSASASTRPLPFIWGRAISERRIRRLPRACCFPFFTEW